VVLRTVLSSLGIFFNWDVLRSLRLRGERGFARLSNGGLSFEFFPRESLGLCTPVALSPTGLSSEGSGR